ncbi:MAG TPA: hypothetical protein VGP44_11990 [Gemmatimonadales bacterium]|nr:hypothetical protein [Gemmatimonadales bacterium]
MTEATVYEQAEDMGVTLSPIALLPGNERLAEVELDAGLETPPAFIEWETVTEYEIAAGLLTPEIEQWLTSNPKDETRQWLAARSAASPVVTALSP